MSLVIAAISKDNDIIVCGEGRSVNTKTKEIVSEDTKKVFKINSLVIIAHTGFQRVSENLVNHLKEVFPELIKWNVKDIYEESLKYQQEHYNKDEDLQFLIAGYECNGTPHLYVINNGPYCAVGLDFKSGKTISLGDDLCKLKFDKENDNIFDIEEKIRILIEERTKINPFINNNIITEYLSSF